MAVVNDESTQSFIFYYYLCWCLECNSNDKNNILPTNHDFHIKIVVSLSSGLKHNYRKALYNPLPGLGTTSEQRVPIIWMLCELYIYMCAASYTYPGALNIIGIYTI